jgi:hypothetical protein
MPKNRSRVIKKPTRKDSGSHDLGDNSFPQAPDPNNSPEKPGRFLAAFPHQSTLFPQESRGFPHGYPLLGREPPPVLHKVWKN